MARKGARERKADFNASPIQGSIALEFSRVDFYGFGPGSEWNQ